MTCSSMGVCGPNKPMNIEYQTITTMIQSVAPSMGEPGQFVTLNGCGLSINLPWRVTWFDGLHHRFIIPQLFDYKTTSKVGMHLPDDCAGTVTVRCGNGKQCFANYQVIEISAVPILQRVENDSYKSRMRVIVGDHFRRSSIVVVERQPLLGLPLNVIPFVHSMKRISFDLPIGAVSVTVRCNDLTSNKINV